MTKRILITSRSFGQISPEPIRILEEAGCELTFRGADFDQAEFEEMMPDYDALIIGAHPFPPELMERCGKLRLICKHGAGLDNIPLEKAGELGIAVTNVPATNSNAVADLAMGLMISLSRGIALSDRLVREGVWRSFVGTDVCFKTLSLLGFGAVARCVARRAHGFGMRVLAYDPYISEVPEEFGSYVTLSDLDSALGEADFISMHMPLTDETRHMISAAQMASMKEGAYIINTARGGVVDEDALYEALRSGHLAGAAMDVTEQEPMDPASPLLTLDNVIVTPHIGMYSREALGAVSLISAQNCAALFSGGELKHVVVAGRR